MALSLIDTQGPLEGVVVKFNDTIAYTVVIGINGSICGDNVIFVVSLQDVALKYFSAFFVSNALELPYGIGGNSKASTLGSANMRAPTVILHIKIAVKPLARNLVFAAKFNCSH